MNSTFDFLTEGKILEIPLNTKYWLVRADGGRYYDDFLLNNYIAVSDNEITLDAIKGHPQLNTEIGYTIEGYKSLYQEKYTDWNNQQIAHAASRTMRFMNEIQLNDIVIVPSHRSNKFIIGIVVSEPYEVDNIESNIQVPVHYSLCPYSKRRKVLWVKEVPRSAISEKMYWILSAHQSILMLDDHSEYIDKLLAPIYVKDGLCYGILKVDKQEGVTSSEWYKLYSVIEDLKDDSSEIVVKSNVESPGYLEVITNLASAPKIISITIVLSGLILGEIKIGGVEVQGIVPYFFGKGKLERERIKLENDNMELDVELKKIEVEERKRESSSLIEVPSEATPELEKAEVKAHEVSHELKISAFNAGKTLGHKMRGDSDHSQDAGGPEEK